MEYKIITDEAGFLAEKENWNAICARMEHKTPFQSWQWNYYWWKHNEPANSLFIIKAFEGKQIFGYAPIVVKNKTAQFIGNRDMDYGLFVVNERSMVVIEGFIQTLLERGISLALQEMPARSAQLHMVQKLLETKKKYILHRTTRTVHVDLPRYGDMDAYMKHLSQSMRNKTIKVGLQKGLQIGPEPVTDALLQEIRAIYENRQEYRGKAPDISWAFPILQSLQQEKMLDVYMARNGEEAVGFLVAFSYENRRYIWLVAFKQEYRDCFPGQLLFYNVLKDGFADGNVRVDFMRGDYDFKMRWECELDANYTVYLCRKYWDYRKMKTVFALKPKLKRIVYSSPLLERILRKYGK